MVDDHMIVHDGLQAMASRADDLEFVGAAETPDDALALLEETRPDVLVLDLRLNGESSTELCATVRRRHPDVIVLMFSAYGNTELLTQAIRAGAAGYVLKDTNTGRMPEILRELVRAGSYFDPRIAGSLLLTRSRTRRNRSPSPSANWRSSGSSPEGRTITTSVRR
ncbi:response regulator transcription factor [Streptomyces cellulosae]|nr:response regulator transcription factor [Streptomyces cellulosae]